MCKRCDLKKLLLQGCPEACEESSFPYLDTAALSEQERKKLFYSLQEKEKEMMSRLARLRFSFIKWTEENLTLDKFKFVTNTIIGTVNSNATSVRNCINAAESHNQLTEVIWNYITWFNCSLLKEIVDHSCEQLKRSKVHMFSKFFYLYEKECMKYCKRNIFECPNILTSELRAVPIISNIFCLIVNDSKKSNYKMSMEDIKLLLGKLIELFKIQNYDLILRSIGPGEGCLELVFLLPPNVHEKIFPLNKKQLEGLAKLRVMDVSTGDSYQSIDTLLQDIHGHLSDPGPDHG